MAGTPRTDRFAATYAWKGWSISWGEESGGDSGVSDSSQGSNGGVWKRGEEGESEPD